MLLCLCLENYWVFGATTKKCKGGGSNLRGRPGLWIIRYTIPIQGSPCIVERSVCQVQYKVKVYPGISPIQARCSFICCENTIQHKVFPVLGGLCLIPNTRWWHFAIQSCPFIGGFWLNYVTCQYKVMSSNTRW